LKKILGLVVLISVNISVNAQQPQDSIFVIIVGDTVHIWNTGALENCASKFRMDISFSADTIFVVEVDTTDIYVPCMCYYDLCASITGLQSGFYIVKVFRDLPLIFPDTLLYIGSTSFAYGGSSISFMTESYQSDCDPITLIEESNTAPNEFELFQNYPNPFNPTTKIKYSISQVGPQRAVSVQLKVYDILGKEVATLVSEEQSAGVYEIELDANKLSSGIYFYHLRAGNFIQTKKLVLMK
jgi:hypothetical protein